MTGAITIDAVRKAELIGRWDSPTLRLTLLYHTPVSDLGWYFIYDHASLRINPFTYFLAHPRELAEKVGYQLWVAFIKQTVPALLSNTQWFVPVILPWLIVESRARMIGYSLLLVLGVQALLSALAFEHADYFKAFIPVICAYLVAVVFELYRRSSQTAHAWRDPGWVTRSTIIAYALLPLVFNVTYLLAGNLIPTGDYTGMKARQEHHFAAFIKENTPDDAVLACAHASLMAWDTDRTIVQYSGHPKYRIANSEMWQQIDRKLPIDFIFLNSLAYERPDMEVLPGFTLVKSLETPDLQAWMFRRSNRSIESR